ncbi:XkdF-like putative serine protease domain-containing protein [Campylobacter concisus]|uniref:XkdF-like putative serine protease domain-containing protein n=1 Tax=Campylobacter concisus TaxID=199 RepID=UPI000CD8BB39|nr:XkdF-like putative serine protease domain-containing protein [Campylobacter concisus]
MANKLTNLSITHISLVKAGANKKSIIYKSDASEPSFEKDVSIAKFDEEKGVVYGIVYSPDEVDTQGDFTDAAEIEKAAYAFMKDLKGQNIDKEHDFKPDGKAYVAESWIVRENDALFKSEKVGSWAVGIKIESDELKELIKSGEIAGLSMAGFAKREEVQKNDTSIAAAIANGFNELLKKFEKTKKGEDKVEKETKEISQAEEIKKTLVEGMDELNKKLLGFEKRISELEDVAKNSKQSKNIEKTDDKIVGGIL